MILEMEKLIRNAAVVALFCGLFIMMPPQRMMNFRGGSRRFNIVRFGIMETNLFNQLLELKKGLERVGRKLRNILVIQL